MSVAPENAWAMVPKSVIAHLNCGDCIRLYCLLDEEQRVGGWPVCGVGIISNRFGWQPRTVKKHLLHLSETGIIRCDPEPLKGMAWGSIRFHLMHNPARGREGDLKPSEVWAEEPPERWRRPNHLDQVVARRATSDASRATDVREKVAVPSSKGGCKDEVLPLPAVSTCQCGEPVTVGSDSCWACAPF